jgi:hypothetical protein
MPTRSEVIASLISKYDAQITSAESAVIETAVMKLVAAQLVDSSFTGSGVAVSGAVIANAGTNLNTSALALNTTVDSLLKPASTLAAVTAVGSVGSITGALPVGTNSIGQVTANAGTNLNTSALALNTTVDSLLKPASTLAAVGSINNALPTGTNSIGQVTANAGTNLNTSALALETGGNLAAVAAWIATQRGFTSTQTITRPANTTAYTANSVWGGAFLLSAVGSANREAIITGVQVIFSNTSVPSGMGAFRLYLYNVTPPSAIADGGAFSLPSGDRANCLTPGGINLGIAQLSVGGGSVVLDTFASNVGSLNEQISVPASANIFGYLVTVGAYTPVSASTAVVRLSTLGA